MICNCPVKRSFYGNLLCCGEDLNLHGLAPTTTSTLRVYQFRHRSVSSNRLQLTVDIIQVLMGLLSVSCQLLIALDSNMTSKKLAPQAHVRLHCSSLNSSHGCK